MVYQQAFSRIGGVSDHMHPPAGIAGGDQLGQRSGVCDRPEVRRSPQPGRLPVLPASLDAVMLIAAFDNRRPPDGHSPVRARRSRPVRYYVAAASHLIWPQSDRLVIRRGRRPHRRQRSHADRDPGRVLHDRAGRTAISRALGRSPFPGDAHAEASLEPRHVLPATVPQDDD